MVAARCWAWATSFLFCLFLFYALVIIYLFGNIALSLLLGDMVGHTRLQLLPWHPDRCGGLRPVGRLGLRNQYALSIFGVNVVLMAWVIIHDIVGPQEEIPASLYALILPASLPPDSRPDCFRCAVVAITKRHAGEQSGAQERDRSASTNEIGTPAQAIAINAAVTKEDEELIERLRKMPLRLTNCPCGRSIPALSASS